MTAPSEIELKLRIRSGDLLALRERLARFGDGATRQIDNTYFDTVDGRLLAAKAGLRLRSLVHGGQKRWVQTFKTDAGGDALSVRGEWETPARGGRLQLAALADSPLSTILGQDKLDEATTSRLQPVFQTNFARTAWQVTWGDDQLEIALDEGFIRAADRQQPILELELELKRGKPASLLQAARWLQQPEPSAAPLSLLPYAPSKAARGYALAQGRPVLPVAAASMVDWVRRSGFAWSWQSARALRHWVWRGVQVILANAEGVSQQPYDPEFVHQARVATRTLRSALDVLPSADRRAAQAVIVFRSLARRLGTARDADVLLTQTWPAVSEGDERKNDAKRLARQRQRLDAHWAKVHRDAQVFFESPRWAALVLDLLTWHLDVDDEVQPPLNAWLPAQTERRWRRLRRSLKRFPDASKRQRHRLRLRAKALRYLYQNLPFHLSAAERKTRLGVIGAFQDAAGTERDLTQARRVLRRTATHQGLRNQLDQRLGKQLDKAIRRTNRAAQRLAEPI